MLSSISAIVGKSGQSNYAVGNAYLDAFAQSKKGEKCKYIALNLGAVDGSLAITSLPAAQQEAMRQGSVLMSFDEVFTVMSYAMGAQTKEDDFHQLVLGFDRKSMEAVHDDFALANPIFSQVPYLAESEGTGQAANNDIGQQIADAKSTEEVHAIFVQGVRERFAMFTARPVEEISPDVSMDHFGLDSLVAIELKNWLVRVFQTSLQTSEVLDSPNIDSMAKTLRLRSKLVPSNISAEGKEDVPAAVAVEEAPQPIGAIVPGANHSFKCCRASKVLQKMPLVDFDTMFDEYLKNSKMFFTPEEFKTLERDVAEFKKDNSLGRKFYNRLYEQAHDPNIENWQDKYFLQSMYLERRQPLAPFNNFMAFHPLGQNHTQAQRAALIANLAFQSKQDLEADRWEPLAYMGFSNCSDLWSYIFNTTRQPGFPLDRMVKFPGYDHMAVFYRGHIFKVMPTNDEGNLSVEALTQIFQAIIDREDLTEDCASILSSDDRTTWAKVRTYLALDSQYDSI